MTAAPRGTSILETIISGRLKAVVRLSRSCQGAGFRLDAGDLTPIMHDSRKGGFVPALFSSLWQAIRAGRD